jgi:prepilin-type processing-associated H-X9-DG protein
LGTRYEDFLWWQASNTPPNAIGSPLRDMSLSRIASYVGGIDRNVRTNAGTIFRCPADKWWPRRVNPQALTRVPYSFSYGLNCFNNQGMGSYLDNSTTNRNKMAKVGNPATKFMISEERFDRSDGLELYNTGRTAFPDDCITDSRYVGSGVQANGSFSGNDVFTYQHNKRADIGFADGHAEAVFSWMCTNNAALDWSR